MSRYEEALLVEKYMNEIFTNDIKFQAIREFITPIIENEKNKKIKRDLALKYSYKDFVATKEISKIINAMCNSLTYYKEAKDNLKVLDERTQDILHAIELTNILDEVSEVDLIERLKVIRQERRVIKNFLETLEPLKKYTEDNKDILDEVKKLQGETNKIQLSLNERKYYVRAEKELEPVFQ